MCAENSLVFSAYACDIWAGASFFVHISYWLHNIHNKNNCLFYLAGICLHIFATGKIPFFSGGLNISK